MNSVAGYRMFLTKHCCLHLDYNFPVRNIRCVENIQCVETNYIFCVEYV